jgi:hypothetical protein
MIISPVYDSNSPSEKDMYVFPASFGQERLWFLDQLEPESTAYTIPTVLQVRGPFDMDALS